MTENKKIGRPTKLNETLKTIALNLWKKGMTDVQVAEICGVSEASITNWKKKDPDFFSSIKEAKRSVDDDVEKALLSRALGYTHDDVEIKVVSDGKDLGSHIEKIDIEKHYPPDVNACRYWLNNRRPEQWREKQEINHSGDLNFAGALQEARNREQS